MSADFDLWKTTANFESFDWWKTTIDPKILETEAAVNKIKEDARAIDNAEKLKQLLSAIGPVINLRSDYLGMTSFYYNTAANKIYEIDNTEVKLVPVAAGVDAHLRELNNLPLLTRR